ncbi:MAG: FAD-dependent oxidoreductase [Candidatus Puniceispirillaceae bacterium]
MKDADIIIIGSGMGGATMAAALAHTGQKIVILERGEQIAASDLARNPQAIFGEGIYRSDEQWLDENDRPFNPGNYYYVGGNSKFYGAVLIRYRACDFDPIQHLDGQTPGWPISYADLEPFYQKAEHLYQVRGETGDDPTEPPHSGSYDFPPVPDEADIADLRRRLAQVGLHPVSLPLGVDIDKWLAGGQTTWDAFPDIDGGKMDAQSIGLQKALSYQNVHLETGCHVTRLNASRDGRISTVEVKQNNQTDHWRAPLVILAAGAVQSAALLLASANDDFPAGLANSSDQLGRHFMNHNATAMLALHPLRKNKAIYQKTVMVNDFYKSGGPNNAPLGNVQLLGKITGPILAANSGLPSFLAHWIAKRSVDFYLMSEDLPDPESRVTLKNGQIKLNWTRSNKAAHDALVQRFRAKLKQAGYPIILSKAFDRKTPSHQSGTARMGDDPSNNVVNVFCRSFDHPNLYITDASVLPTSAAVNPSLTIAALALRSAEHIIQQELS